MSSKRKSRKAAQRSEQRSAPEPSGNVWMLRVAAVVLTVLGVVPMANFVTTGVGLPWYGGAALQWLIATLVVASVALVLGKVFTDRVEAAFVWGERMLLAPSSRVFAALLGIATFLLALYFGWRIFSLEPGVGDEFAQRWQAHLLATGHLTGLAPAHPEFFSTIQSLELRGRWFSQFPIGGPAVLAVGELLHAPWLINPFLAGIAAIAFYDFVSSIADEVTARVSSILFALSPFVLFMSGSQMNHAGALTCLLIALAALARWSASESAARARWMSAVIGVSLGVAATIRPFDAAVVAVVIGIFQLHAIRTNPALLRSLMVQCVAGLVPVLVLLAANRAMLGSAVAFAYDVLNGPEHRPGFHMTPQGFVHTPVRGLYMASAYLMKLDIGLFGWPIPAMLVIVATLALQRRANMWDALLLAILGALLVGYAAYWSESYFMGPRFLYAAVPVFVYYTARMTTVVRDRIRQPSLRAATLLLVPLWLLAAWITPPREKLQFGVQQMAKLYRTQPTAPSIRNAVRAAGLTHALVFLPEGFHSRLASRLRAFGLRPLGAEQIVARVDACVIKQALDSVDGFQGNREQRVIQTLAPRSEGASQLAGQPPSDQLALVPGRELSADCQQELSQIPSYGVSVAAMLPYVSLSSDGRMDGPIVYARDFGRRNEVLRAEYGDRAWYVVRAAGDSGGVTITLEPWR